jgi:phosphopantothenoylcysteine decarboxylase/phosphopantothenate--cysteine ligase
MGYALAQAARERGARVILVSGPVALPPPPGIETVYVETAAEMYETVMERLPAATVVIKAAAVADYRPARAAGHKMKKSEGKLSLELEPTNDILAAVGRVKGNRVLVGFAAETQNLLAEGRRKLEHKNCDLLVANIVGRPGTGFESDSNEVKILDRSGGVRQAGPAPKTEIAHLVLDRVAALLRSHFEHAYEAKTHPAGLPAPAGGLAWAQAV